MSNDTINSDNTPLEFPCHFPLKVMGSGDDIFKDAVITIIKKHIPEIQDEHVSERNSSNNKFLSLTITVYVSSRDQLDAIYRELHACEHVLMSL